MNSQRADFQNFVIELPETRSKQKEEGKKKVKDKCFSFHGQTGGTFLRGDL